VGALRVATRFRGTTQTEEFRLVPGTAQPVVVNLYDGSVPFTWGLAVRGGKEQPGDPKTGALFQPEAGISCGGVLHDGLFSHPPYAGGVGYSYAVFAPVTLPTEPCELHLFVGLRDGGDPSDGVDFTVEAIRQDGSEVALLKTNTAERKWTELTADLSALVGQTVRFRLIADVGPNDDSRADWASWGEPTVRLKTPVPTVTIKP
jgi:hypothetical protein